MGGELGTAGAGGEAVRGSWPPSNGVVDDDASVACRSDNIDQTGSLNTTKFARPI